MMQSPKLSQPPVIPAKAGTHTMLPIDSGFRRNDTIKKGGPDRLSHAIFFANELNDSRLRKIKASWTDARRKKQSLQIQKVKPWRRSTGPKTAQGKARCAANSNKGRDPAIILTNRALRALAAFLTRVRRISALQDAGLIVPDSLLDFCRMEGEKVTRNLLEALVFAGFMDPVTERNNE